MYWDWECQSTVEIPRWQQLINGGDPTLAAHQRWRSQGDAERDDGLRCFFTLRGEPRGDPSLTATKFLTLFEGAATFGAALRLVVDPLFAFFFVGVSATSS